MKRANLIVVVVGLALVAIFTADASAMYDPATGTFLQRDPGPGSSMRVGAAGPTVSDTFMTLDSGAGEPMRVGVGGVTVGGQFVSRDPARQYADGMNLYQYVQSNPVNLTDCSGLVAGREGDVFSSITVKRKHVKWLAILKEHLGKKPSGEDTYGHWWFEFDGESYGWWPKNGVDLIGTLAGVPGQLNGTDAAYAAGIASATRDAHHGDSAEEQFNPRRRLGFFGRNELEYGSAKGIKCDCATEDQAEDCLRGFAHQYSGKWSYPWGQNCHSFQKKGMGSCCLKK